MCVCVHERVPVAVAAWRQREEERARCIMLSEEADKSKHESAQLSAQLQTAEARWGDRVDKLTREYGAAVCHAVTLLRANGVAVLQFEGDR